VARRDTAPAGRAAASSVSVSTIARAISTPGTGCESTDYRSAIG
jgi:hypothetical protein